MISIGFLSGSRSRVLPGFYNDVRSSVIRIDFAVHFGKVTVRHSKEHWFTRLYCCHALLVGHCWAAETWPTGCACTKSLSRAGFVCSITLNPKL